MAGGHGQGHVHALYVHGEGRLHRVPPQCKLAAAVLFAFAVATTPREAFWAFAVDAALVLGLARFGGLRLRQLAPRLAIELPFVLFAVALPFVGQGPHTEVAGLSLSVPGLWGAWNVLAKGTLGVAAAIVLAATTPVPDLLRGLDRLRVPAVITAIAGFMVRYLDLTVAEAQRMAVARRSRGHDPRWLGQAGAVAASAGTLFIRSYERGERVHLAMLSRGYDGRLPATDGAPPAGLRWLPALAVPAAAALVSLLAWTVLR